MPALGPQVPNSIVTFWVEHSETARVRQHLNYVNILASIDVDQIAVTCLELDLPPITHTVIVNISPTSTMASVFLDLYDPLDIIGNGSFGIIRKVRRKSDGLVSLLCHCPCVMFSTLPGQIFARKELNFERMSERDRKQIVAEVYVASAFSALRLTQRLVV